MADKWLIERTDLKGLKPWVLRSPDGPSRYFNTHAEAVADMSVMQREKLQEALKANPLASLALLVLAGLASKAQQQQEDGE